MTFNSIVDHLIVDFISSISLIRCSFNSIVDHHLPNLDVPLSSRASAFNSIVDHQYVERATILDDIIIALSILQQIIAKRLYLFLILWMQDFQFYSRSSGMVTGYASHYIQRATFNSIVDHPLRCLDVGMGYLGRLSILQQIIIHDAGRTTPRTMWPFQFYSRSSDPRLAAIAITADPLSILQQIIQLIYLWLLMLLRLAFNSIVDHHILSSLSFMLSNLFFQFYSRSSKPEHLLEAIKMYRHFQFYSRSSLGMSH